MVHWENAVFGKFYAIFATQIICVTCGFIIWWQGKRISSRNDIMEYIRSSSIVIYRLHLSVNSSSLCILKSKVKVFYKRCPANTYIAGIFCQRDDFKIHRASKRCSIGACLCIKIIVHKICCTVPRKNPHSIGQHFKFKRRIIFFIGYWCRKNNIILAFWYWCFYLRRRNIRWYFPGNIGFS